mmetsp:Transcript_29130/g.95007  ORF Transcript_29130/g.95007 Transcript_29130/m.95007 type:complete len:318 (-) Transcript_29130:1426-2379(-)
MQLSLQRTTELRHHLPHAAKVTIHQLMLAAAPPRHASSRVDASASDSRNLLHAHTVRRQTTLRPRRRHHHRPQQTQLALRHLQPRHQQQLAAVPAQPPGHRLHLDERELAGARAEQRRGHAGADAHVSQQRPELEHWRRTHQRRRGRPCARCSSTLVPSSRRSRQSMRQRGTHGATLAWIAEQALMTDKQRRMATLVLARAQRLRLAPRPRRRRRCRRPHSPWTPDVAAPTAGLRVAPPAATAPSRLRRWRGADDEAVSSPAHPHRLRLPPKQAALPGPGQSQGWTHHPQPRLLRPSPSPSQYRSSPGRSGMLCLSR